MIYVLILIGGFVGLLLYHAYNVNCRLGKIEAKHRALAVYLKVSPTETEFGGYIYRKSDGYWGIYPDHLLFERMAKEVEDAIKENDFEISLIRNRMSEAIMTTRFNKSLYGLTEEDCDQAFINYCRRSGFTKEKIEKAGYNPAIAENGIFGTGGHKN